MTLSFPAPFPDLCAPVTGSTPLKRFQVSAFDGDGGQGSADVAPAIRMGQYSFTARGRAAVAQWQAWAASLRGGMRTFKGIPIRDGRKLYRWPLTRPQGFSGLTVSSSPWSGSGNLSAIADAKDQITINAMPNGLVLSPGDFVSFPVGSVNHLHMILDGGTVSGNSVTVMVEPVVRPDAVTSVAVAFESPWCDCYLAGDVSESGNMTAMTFSFTAYQKPR